MDTKRRFIFIVRLDNLILEFLFCLYKQVTNGQSLRADFFAHAALDAIAGFAMSILNQMVLIDGTGRPVMEHHFGIIDREDIRDKDAFGTMVLFDAVMTVGARYGFCRSQDVADFDDGF